jgi:hypothetical protein
MDFRVELSAQAQSDISSIHDWLRSQSAGETASEGCTQNAAIWRLARAPFARAITNLEYRFTPNRIPW